MRCLAIIPARSGSKGLKNKNIRLLCGKHLLGYSITEAINSKCFSRVHVSTDSEEYAKISRMYGADVRFLRDDNNSSDKSSTWDVVREVLNKYLELGESFDYFMLLQPTSPLRNSNDIINSFNLLKQKKAEAIVSVCEVKHSPKFTNYLDDSLSMKHFINLNVNEVGRQNLGTAYRLNGAVYLVNVESFLKSDSIYDKDVYAYIMPEERSVDIDDLSDFNIAEYYMENNLLEAQCNYDVIGEYKNNVKLTNYLRKVMCIILNGNLSILPTGKYEVDNSLSFCVYEYNTLDTQTEFEVHRQNVDIHYVIKGEEVIHISDDYNCLVKSEQNDCEIYKTKDIKNSFKLSNDNICIIDRNVLHSPGNSLSHCSKVKKVVFKIKI